MNGEFYHSREPAVLHECIRYTYAAAGRYRSWTLFRCGECGRWWYVALGGMPWRRVTWLSPLQKWRVARIVRREDQST